MKLSISEIIDATSNLKTDEDKVAFLQKNKSQAMLTLLRVQYDKSVELHIDESNIPDYKPSVYPDSYGLLYKEYRMMYYLIKGMKGETLSQERRIKLAYQVLETIDKNDAEYFKNVLLKVPSKGITLNIIKQAFPGLIRHEEVKQTKVSRKKG